MENRKSTRYIIKSFLGPYDPTYEEEKQDIEFRKKIRSIFMEHIDAIREHLKESKEKSKGESSE